MCPMMYNTDLGCLKMQKQQPVCVLFNNIQYFNSKELINYDPVFGHGFKTKPRNIIAKKNIPPDDYVYATFNSKQNEWKHSSPECKKAQILITKTWADKHYFKNVRVIDDVDNADVVAEYKIAPDIIELNPDEKFTDENGAVIEIETRGTKTEDGIYFRVSDVSKGFGINSLDTSLHHEEGGYIKGNDYETFIRGTLPIKQSTPIKNTNDTTFNQGKAVNNSFTSFKKCLYLTYRGLCRALFVSRNKHTERFKKWAVNKLFTIQMGQEIDRKKLGAELCGITIKQLTNVFGANCAQYFSCIYLLALGKVKDLRATFNIDPDVKDDDVVYKFGFSSDFTRRLKEHNLNYGKLNNVSITIAAYHQIDPKYTTEAEREMREFCKSFELKLNVDRMKELITLNVKQLGQVKTQYKYIGKSYSGATSEMQNKVEELLTTIKDTQHTYSQLIKEKEIELLRKDLIIKDEQHKVKCLQMQYDLVTENLELKLKLAERN